MNLIVTLATIVLVDDPRNIGDTLLIIVDM